jgi:CRISPR-associated protein Csx17
MSTDNQTSAGSAFEHVLEGCAPVPLAHYLKALAILRLVAEQKDPEARGCWRGLAFVLTTRLDREALLRFFLEEYRPTPIVAPWNGGSGFAPNDNKEALEAIESGSAERLADYRETIARAHELFHRFAGDQKVAKEAKDSLFLECRNRLPERALGWLDAACVLTEERPAYPPLLGTGGNDGRLDFTNNFMQRLLDVVSPSDGAPTASARRMLESAIFGTQTPELQKASVGQFLPGSAGGANAATGFDGASLVNPWDFVLMLEGAVVFAAAAVKRLSGGPSSLASPFTVRSSGVGYGSASGADENDSRGEIWLPTWSHPATAAEIAFLFSEGRAQVGRRQARHGVDFARAAASLGVDRGLDSFQRYGFHARNGLAYFATPLDSVPVRFNPRTRLLDEIDAWIEGLRSRANGDRAPASVRRSVNRLDRAILALCRGSGARVVQEVLLALGDCEAQLATSLKWTQASFLRPLPGLSRQWLADGDDGSPEWRLAASLASLYDPACGSLRGYLEPAKAGKRDDGSRWSAWRDDDRLSAVWEGGSLVHNLGRVLERWLLKAEAGAAEGGGVSGRQAARLEDLQRFLQGTLDEERLAGLLWGLALVEPPPREERARARAAGAKDAAAGSSVSIDPRFALLKLCLAGRAMRGASIPMQRTIFRRALAGDMPSASREASRRLRGSGLVPAVEALAAPADFTRRCAAALLFPLSPSSLERLATSVLRPSRTEAQP